MIGFVKNALQSYLKNVTKNTKKHFLLKSKEKNQGMVVSATAEQRFCGALKRLDRHAKQCSKIPSFLARFDTSCYGNNAMKNMYNLI